MVCTLSRDVCTRLSRYLSICSPILYMVLVRGETGGNLHRENREAISIYSFYKMSVKSKKKKKEV